MGWRFRDSIRLLPGIRLNISKGGLSTSIGVPGATINLSRRGTRGTVGLPGSGISYSRLFGSNAAIASDDSQDHGSAYGIGETIGRGFRSGCGILFVIIFAGFLLTKCVVSSPSIPVLNSSTEQATTPVNSLFEAGEAAYVDADVLNGRAEPNTKSAVLTKLRRGDFVSVKERQGDWAKVVKGAVTVWLLSKHLSSSMIPAKPEPVARSSLASENDTRNLTKERTRKKRSSSGGGCSCGARNVCVGPRGGRYCITSGGAKRYGV